MLEIVIYAAIAVYLINKLYKVLGDKKYDPQDEIKHAKNSAPESVNLIKVVKNEAEITAAREAQEEKKYGKEVLEQIKEIRKIDSSFSMDDFANGAKSAFEMILKAYSQGKKEELEHLVSKDLYSGLVKEIENRERKGEIHETTIISDIEIIINTISVRASYATIEAKFISDQVNLVKDKNNNIIDGDPAQVDKITDVWTFGRALKNKDPNWELVKISSE